MAAPSRRRTKPRGSIDELPSGAFRIRLYAGVDPVTNRQLYLTEVIEPGPRAGAWAEKARTRLLNQVDERRHPRTNATLSQLLERHLSMLRVAPSTMSGYSGYMERHIDPIVGNVKAGARPRVRVRDVVAGVDHEVGFEVRERPNPPLLLALPGGEVEIGQMEDPA